VYKRQPFGNESEGLFAAAIEYLETGQTSGCDILTKSVFKPELPQEGQGPLLILNR